MKPLPIDQVQATMQVLLAFLDSDDAKVPGNMIDGVASSKQLLRGIAAQQLFVCSPDPAPTPDKDVQDEEPAPVE